MNSLFGRLESWLAKKFPFYTLDGDSVAPRKSLGARFSVLEIHTWRQVFICAGVYDIIIEFVDGTTRRLGDHGEQLIRILKQKAPERELPWSAE